MAFPQTPPEFANAEELLRVARDLRLDLGNLGPVQFRGGASFGYGFNRGDMSQLGRAVSEFERACLASQQPQDTLPAFRHLRQAYDRAWRPGPFGTASVRDIDHMMERLNRFYATLEPPTP